MEAQSCEGFFLDTLVNYEFCFVNVQSAHHCAHDVFFLCNKSLITYPKKRRSEFCFVNLPIVDYFIGFGRYFLFDFHCLSFLQIIQSNIFVDKHLTFFFFFF